MGVDNAQKYVFDMKVSMQRMKSPVRFSLDQILERGLPAQSPPTGEVFEFHLAQVKQKCEDRSLRPSKVNDLKLTLVLYFPCAMYT